MDVINLPIIITVPAECDNVVIYTLRGMNEFEAGRCAAPRVVGWAVSACNNFVLREDRSKRCF